MSGTDKILRHIANQADAEAAGILDKAREEAAHLEENAKAERAEILAAARQQGEAILAEARERSQVSAATRKRRTLLAARGGLVQEALEKAWETILTLPEGEYFDFLYAQLEKQDLAREGVLLLNEKDLHRRPVSFATRIASVAKKQKGSLSLSEEAVDIQGGFILNYGGVVENCSLEAIFESEADILKDAVRAVLFED